MRILSTKLHGIFDYIVSLVLLMYPLITGFTSPDNWISAIAGTGIGFYSLLTQYETGLIKRISIYSHVMFDICSGLFLIISPWIFNFSRTSAIFYLACGSILLLYTALTDTKTFYRRYMLHPSMYTL